MTGRQRLVVRGSLASAVATLLAAISHTHGGGAPPPPTIVIGMAALLVLPAGVLMGGTRPPHRAGTGRRLGRIAATTAVAQLAFHGIFSVLGSPEAGTAVASSHQHGALAHTVAASAGSAAVHSPMLAAHIGAAIATVAILAYGEGVLLRGWDWVRASLRALVSTRTFPDVPRVVANRVPRIRLTPVAAPATGVRGPPVLS